MQQSLLRILSRNRKLLFAYFPSCCTSYKLLCLFRVTAFLTNYCVCSRVMPYFRVIALFPSYCHSSMLLALLFICSGANLLHFLAIAIKNFLPILALKFIKSDCYGNCILIFETVNFGDNKYC